MRQVIFETVLPALLPFLSAALLWLLKQGGSWLAAKAQQSRALNVAASGYELVRAIVEHVERHMRDEVQKALADGQLSKQEADELKAMAMRLAKEAFGTVGLVKLRQVFGNGVDLVLSGWIERAVREAKAPQAPLSEAPVNPL